LNESEADRVRELGEVLQEFDLDAIRIKLGEAEYELVRREAVAAPFVIAAPPAPPVAPEPVAPAGPAVAAPSVNVKKVTAPVVGVFYRSSSPGSDPFVNVGDRVEIGKTLCILEAMKHMNEIESDYAGVVSRIFPENGELVSLGQELLWIEP
jgi:acetyl-CoA carboxylase biotin carboxyl carrier protein